MAMVGISMVRSFGLPVTMEYFLNGLLGGVKQGFGRTTMENLCNAITMGNEELFKETLSNNGSLTASLSFPVGQTYYDVDSAWQAVRGIGIEINGDINSSGLYTAVPVYLLLPFSHQAGDIETGKNQYASTIIRLEFEDASNKTGNLSNQSSERISPELLMKQSHFLKSVEFYFEF